MNNKKRKLVFVLGSLRMGGAERMMINLANELTRRAEVTVILLTKGSDLRHELDPAIPVVSFSKNSTRNAFLPLRKFLRETRPDVMISTQIHVNILCMLARITSAIPTKIILREATTPGIHFRLNKGIRTFFTRKLMKWVYPKADAVVVNSLSAKRDLIGNKFVSEEKIRLIYNPVITENFKAAMLENISHKYFGKFPVFISVGRLVAAKNYSLLIKAFAKVLDKTDARLILVGEGAERNTLEAKILDMKLQDKINLTGQIVNPYPLMRKADVFVLTSNYEGLPNSLIEAMACGTQVVSTDSSGGACEILMEGRLGLMVPVDDAGMLADAMVKALEKKVTIEDLIKSTDRFEAAKVAYEYFLLTEKVCNG